eukprot:TRINITY_DN2635_c0_g1_i3.p1 TRINITY_DN2635_c0_g1~~TRINITY_DN2635_c0_g1_i3.p1  ORF type:complete len:2075 (+),score=399.17 TRINITY_DN2635_c0_g1_i3:584-6226(+)
MHYYRDKATAFNSTPVGTLIIDAGTLINDTPDPALYDPHDANKVFSLRIGAKETFFLAASAEERNEWLRLLMAARAATSADSRDDGSLVPSHRGSNLSIPSTPLELPSAPLLSPQLPTIAFIKAQQYKGAAEVGASVWLLVPVEGESSIFTLHQRWLALEGVSLMLSPMLEQSAGRVLYIPLASILSVAAPQDTPPPTLADGVDTTFSIDFGQIITLNLDIGSVQLLGESREIVESTVSAISQAVKAYRRSDLSLQSPLSTLESVLPAIQSSLVLKHPHGDTTFWFSVIDGVLIWQTSPSAVHCTGAISVTLIISADLDNSAGGKGFTLTIQRESIPSMQLIAPSPGMARAWVEALRYIKVAAELLEEQQTTLQSPSGDSDSDPDTVVSQTPRAGIGKRLEDSADMSEATATDSSLSDGALAFLGSLVPEIVVRRFVSHKAPLTAPESEMFQAAVLFADIGGFTALAERLRQSERGAAVGFGAEQLTEYINHYFKKLVEEVRNHGGDVIKFAGDAVMAVWRNGPLWLTTLQATTCALEIQSALQGTTASSPTTLRLHLHIGIGAGKVEALHVGGIMGQWEFFVRGPAVEQIAEAEKIAKNGEVVLSPEASREIQDHCEWRQTSSAQYRVAERVKNPLPPRPSAPPTVTPDMAEALRGYIQPIVSLRLKSGQQSTWIAESRRVSVLFLRLEQREVKGMNFLEGTQMAVALLQRTVYHFEGTIRQFLLDDKGSVLVAAFGLPPWTHENDSARCVKAAMELQKNLQEELGIDSYAGMTVGTALCGFVGSTQRAEFAMVGDVVNLAARLMMAADRGTALCDRALYEACNNVSIGNQKIKFRAQGLIKVKGKAEKILVYTPVGTTTNSTTKALQHSFLVGRDRERRIIFAQISKLLGKTLRPENLDIFGEDDDDTEILGPPVIVLEGMPGMGKTALLVEATRAAERVGGCTICQCDAFSESALTLRDRPAAPAASNRFSFNGWHRVFAVLFIESSSMWQLKAGLGNAEREGGLFAQHIREQITERLRTHKDAQILLPLLPLANAVLPSVGFPATEAVNALQTEASRLQASISLLVALLEVAPAAERILVSIDNAQWLDAPSWTLVLEVGKRLSSRVALLIGMRPLPAPLPAFDELLAPNTPSVVLRLRPLTTDEATKVVCKNYTIDHLPPPVYEAVVGRSAGNPYFVAELMFQLMFTEVLSIENGKCRLAAAVGSLNELPLPEAVQDLIRSRIDALLAPLQLIVKVASVAGGSFSLKFLNAVHPVPGEIRGKLDADLLELERLEFFARVSPRDSAATTDQSTPPSRRTEVFYSFVHDVYRDVAYNLLLFDQRRKLHLAVAEFLESQIDTTPAQGALTEIASHFVRAEAYERAISAYEKEGNWAMRSGEWVVAAESFSRAHQLCVEQVPQLDSLRHSQWLQNAGDALYRIGDMIGSRSNLEASLAVLGHALPRATTTAMLVPQLQSVVGDKKKTTASQTGKGNAHPWISGVYERLARVYWFVGEKHLMLDAATRALTLTDLHGSADERLRSYALIAVAVQIVGYHSLAADFAARAGERLKQPCLPTTAAFTHTHLALLGLSQGALNEIEESLTRATEFCTRVADKRLMREVLHTASLQKLFLGKYQKSLELARELRAISTLDPHATLMGCLAEGRALVLMGDWDNALQVLLDAKSRVEVRIAASADPTLSGKSADVPFQIEVHGLLAMVRSRRGQHLLAAESAAIALDLCAACPQGTQPQLFLSQASIAELFFEDLQGVEGHDDVARSMRSTSEQQLSTAMSLLSKTAQDHPIAVPRLLILQGLVEISRGNAEGLDLLNKSRRASEKLHLPLEQALACFAVAALTEDAAKRSIAKARQDELQQQLGVKVQIALPSRLHMALSRLAS